MSPVLDGVRIGQLDPDRGENFGQVGGSNTARQLMRHHQAQMPPMLRAALSRQRHDARSTAIDKAEVEAFIRQLYEEADEAIPEDSKITGMAVRGEDDQPDLQVLTFTFTTAGGRSAKGFVPYDDENLPRTVAAGDEAHRIAELKEAGLPWAPSDAALAAAGIPGTGVAPVTEDASGEKVEQLEARVSELDAENDELVDERDKAREERDAMAAKVEDLEARIAAVEGLQPPTTTAGGEGTVEVTNVSGVDVPAGEPTGVAPSPEPVVGDQPPEDATASAGEPPSEPWEGYEADKAQDVRQKLRESGDQALAQAVLDYETSKPDGGRSTVISAANELLDRPPTS